jgi:uncharacterized protein
MFKRTIESQIKKWLFKKEVLIIYGARQVGKTTFAKEIAKEIDPNYKYIDCDLNSNRGFLSSQDDIILKTFVGDSKVVILDEAQRVENIGLNLKILHTYCPDTQFIATGSSSFDLANKINEPLTGRNIKFYMYPLSLTELLTQDHIYSLKGKLEQFLIYGLYPGVYNLSVDNKAAKLLNISQDYLYRDVLAMDLIKKISSLEDLVRYLALSIGKEQSYTNIATKLNMDKKTVEKYITLLEQSFVIFRLKPLYRNIVKEIRKPFKIYFWDLGVRNAILENFLPINAREDIGYIWENFCIVERMKLNNNKIAKYHFWRTNDQKEYDLIEEKNGTFEVFEIKWNESRNAKHHQEFFDNYKTINNSGIANIINRDNWENWLV